MCYDVHSEPSRILATDISIYFILADCQGRCFKHWMTNTRKVTRKPRYKSQMVQPEDSGKRTTCGEWQVHSIGPRMCSMTPTRPSKKWRDCDVYFPDRHCWLCLQPNGKCTDWKSAPYVAMLWWLSATITYKQLIWLVKMRSVTNIGPRNSHGTQTAPACLYSNQAENQTRLVQVCRRQPLWAPRWHQIHLDSTSDKIPWELAGRASDWRTLPKWWP